MMILLNDYFHTDRQANKGPISVSGKLEAYVGNYFVSGEGVPGKNILRIYYDSKINNLYEAVECKKENLIALMTSDYEYAFVKEFIFQKFREDISGYNTTIVPVRDFDTPECCVNEKGYLPDFLSKVCWIRDDFLSDESIEFDNEAFELIDDGVDYLNPDHFSVNEIIAFISNYRTF